MLYSDFYQKIPRKKAVHGRLKLQGQSWPVLLHTATLLVALRNQQFPWIST